MLQLSLTVILPIVPNLFCINNIPFRRNRIRNSKVCVMKEINVLNADNGRLTDIHLLATPQ